MKVLVFVLAGLFLPLQTVSYMDCCCGDFCTHKNACTGCEEDQSKPCEVDLNYQTGGDCCPDQGQTKAPHQEHHRKACSHVSPSSEVDVHATQVHYVPPIDDLLVVLPPVPDVDLIGAVDYLIEKVPRAASDVPRHLLLSVLQV